MYNYARPALLAFLAPIQSICGLESLMKAATDSDNTLGALAWPAARDHCIADGSSASLLHAEILQYTGVAHFSEARWWNVGYAKLQGEDLNYLGVPGLRIAGSQGILIIAVCQVSSVQISIAFRDQLEINAWIEYNVGHMNSRRLCNQRRSASWPVCCMLISSDGSSLPE